MFACISKTLHYSIIFNDFGHHSSLSGHCIVCLSIDGFSLHLWDISLHLWYISLHLWYISLHIWYIRLHLWYISLHLWDIVSSNFSWSLLIISRTCSTFKCNICVHVSSVAKTVKGLWVLYHCQLYGGC